MDKRKTVSQMELSVKKLLFGVNRSQQWWDKHLFKPFARGINEINTAKQTTTNDYLALRKLMPKGKKMLRKKVADTEFTHDAAIRVHRWTEAGYEVPGLLYVIIRNY